MQAWSLSKRIGTRCMRELTTGPGLVPGGCHRQLLHRRCARRREELLRRASCSRADVALKHALEQHRRLHRIAPAAGAEPEDMAGRAAGE